MAAAIRTNLYSHVTRENERILIREQKIQRQVKGAYIIGIISMIASFIIGSWILVTLACLWLILPWDSIVRESTPVDGLYNRIFTGYLR